MDAHGNLTGELTGFVGRRAELALVRQSLSAARLVTLTGPGGIGKTRLALRTASAAQRAFRDGVWLTELAGLRDPALLAAELARSLGLSDQATTWGVTALSDHLAARQALLILDGCEHLTDGCAVLADALLRRLPAGALLTEQGAAADDLYLLLDGLIGVSVDGKDLGELGPGAVIGERAILEGGRRTATVRAATPCLVAVAARHQIDTDSLARLAEYHHREDALADG